MITNITLKFILSSFIIVIIYDIFAKIWQDKKEKKFGIVTITSIFRRWFGTDKEWKQKGRPIVPYIIGVLIGHFGVYQWNGLLVEKISIWLFIILSTFVLVYQIIEALKKNKNKFYIFLCKFWPASMLAGILVGSFWQ